MNTPEKYTQKFKRPAKRYLQYAKRITLPGSHPEIPVNQWRPKSKRGCEGNNAANGNDSVTT